MRFKKVKVRDNNKIDRGKACEGNQVRPSSQWLASTYPEAGDCVGGLEANVTFVFN